MPDKAKRSRVWTYGSSSLVSSLFFFGILVVVALIAQRHSVRWDLTEAGSFTLTEQTRKVLKTVANPIQIKAFFATGAPEWPKAKDLLDTYQYANKLISYEMIDPDRQPEISRRYEVRAYGTLILEGYDRQQQVQTADEENLTNAILKLLRKEEKKVYFLIGHGEHPIEGMDKDGYSSVRTALEKENYKIEPLNLLQQASVPEDASVVVVAGPTKALFSQELDSLKAFIAKGGKLMVFLDPEHDAGLKEFLAAYGVELHKDIIIDKLSRVFGGSYLMPVVTEYGTHKITENFNVATFFPEARSVRPVEQASSLVQAQTLASTSANAWAETDFEMLGKGQAGFDEKSDQLGPVPMVVLAEITGKDEVDAKTESNPGDTATPAAAVKGYVLVAGDSNFADNTHFSLSGNGDLFLNMVNFLAQEEHLITIERREKDGQPLLLTQTQARLIFWVVLVLMPLLAVVSGFAVYRVRRNQR